ncbi:MAG: peroxiredoxin family protein [Elusimicrobiota bacterium]
MMRHRTQIIWLAAAILAAAGFFWARSALTTKDSSKAPGFDLYDTSGKVVSLSDYGGKVVLVNFWATWCPACREEIPDLESVYERRKKDGFTALGLSVDEEGRNAVLPFIAQSGITYPVLLCDPKTAAAYRVWELPASFLVGPDGVVARRYIGPIDPRALENDILTLIHPNATRRKT